jgi:CheY-like chemotaxis protein
MREPAILIVEDEGLIALYLQELLEMSGYSVPALVSPMGRKRSNT